MPETRKQRRVRERAQLEQKRLMDDAVTNAPSHVRQRLNAPSQTTENMLKGISRYGYRGLRFTEDGQEIRSEPLGAAGAAARKRGADEKCEELRSKYKDWWGNKKRIRHIAEREGISERTVRRYYRRCLK
jgi:hypothetical protein